MNRRNQILAGILALQLVIIAAIFWPRRAASVASGKSLFPGVEADRIAGLTITDAQSQSVQLARRDSGWALPEADDYPCAETKVTTLLSKIVGLKTDRLVTQTSGSHKRLKVAEGAFERRIEFELADGTRHRLYLGTSPSGSATHVRADDQNEVYLGSDFAVWDVGSDATAWVDSVYFSVPQDQVTALTLENANGRLDFTRISTDTWTMQGLGATERLDQNQVQALLGRGTSVSMQKPLGKQDKPEYGASKPSAVVTLQTSSSDGSSRTYTLNVGAQDATDKSYVIRSSESAYYVRVYEYAANDFVTKQRKDFLELPPTPEPTPSS